eukprot:scaffold8567_cov277-Pinguiococcus_pyrenoidosus.AAC.5
MRCRRFRNLWDVRGSSSQAQPQGGCFDPLQGPRVPSPEDDRLKLRAKNGGSPESGVPEPWEWSRGVTDRKSV